MIDCTRTRDDEKKFIPDDEVYFIDGFLYIITRTYVEGKDWGNDVKYGIKVECLCAEYDDPITLKDIETRYPNVCKVIYEDFLGGDIYSYGNHSAEPGAENWELVGHTIGFA